MANKYSITQFINCTGVSWLTKKCRIYMYITLATYTWQEIGLFP